MRPDTQKRIAEQREVYLEKAEHYATRDLEDQRFNKLRTTTARKRLVIVTAITLLGLLLGNLWQWPVVSLIALLAFALCLVALRIAVRNIVDMPDELVDERMRAQRGEVYRLAFFGIVAVFSLLFTLDIAALLGAKVGLGVQPLSAEQWRDCVMTVFFTAIAMPSAIYAWRAPHV